MDQRTLVSEARSAIQSSPVFEGMPKPLLEKLADSAVLERYETSSAFIRSGASTSFARYVRAGYCYLRGESKDGRELQLGRTGEGKWFGWVLVFSPLKVEKDHWAAAGSEFIAFPKSAILEVAAAWPQIYHNAFLDTGRMVQSILRWVWTFHLSSDDEKVAKLIVQMLPATLRTGRYCLTCSQADLASLCGFGRQAVSRHLTVLEEKSLIVRAYRKIEIPDVERLRSYAERDELI
ncbi:MAG: Crp/Fnr family transcriptional regulator [Alphaproteobacteria bacterium]|nr:Crp/Fnr family transcriptional regulator [Alphaproteobacteria bacterium]